jgi:RNA polymerase sigma factor (sigma-70 family)
MTGTPPPELTRLLNADDPKSRDGSWQAFVRAHSRILLHTARRFGGDYDSAMDRYAYVLEELRHDDFKRLRTYVAGRRSKFTTWLVVVARRLCLDYERHRYGRVRGPAGGGAGAERLTRRRLVDLVAERLDPSALANSSSSNPETELRAVELQEALGSALSRLEGRDRLLLALRYGEKLPAREIAVLMDFPSAFHVYRRLEAVQRSLRDVLKARGVDGAEP